jgi:hypothetical protein
MEREAVTERSPLSLEVPEAEPVHEFVRSFDDESVYETSRLRLRDEENVLVNDAGGSVFVFVGGTLCVTQVTDAVVLHERWPESVVE